jgi:signal transduction histidine kinase
MDTVNAPGRLAMVDRLVADGLLAFCLVAMGVIGLLTGIGSGPPPEGGEPAPTALAALLMACQSAPVTWRRRAPLPVLAVVELATIAYFLLRLPATGAALGVLIAFYTVAVRYPAPVVLPFALPLEAAALALAFRGDLRLDGFVLLQVLLATAWAMGAEQRARRAHTAAVEDRAARLERELGYLAREAVADERVRITRELHETVTSNVSRMVDQARAAERTLAVGDAPTRQALTTIGETAERTLSELRRGFQVLDPGEPVVTAVEPDPSMSQLSALVSEVKMAGLPVDVKVEGDAVPLPAEVDGSAYRIVQEALTSCLKRPGPARPQVVIRYREENLELQVSGDRGGSAWQVVPERGRYQSLGWMQPSPPGQEPDPEAWLEGGYGVLARLPIASASS